MEGEGKALFGTGMPNNSAVWCINYGRHCLVYGIIVVISSDVLYKPQLQVS